MDVAKDWPQYLTACLLVMVRLSGVVAFAPLFSSQAIAPRIKAGFVFAMACLLAPAVAAIPGARVTLGIGPVLGELSVGLVFGFSLTLLTEALDFAGALLGMSFSFSLVNLLDPNSHIETALLSQLFNLLSTMIIIAGGLDRALLSAVVRSFRAVPVGDAALLATTSASLAAMAGGIFLAGLQLAAPVLAAALAVEMTVSMVSRLAPQLPAMVMSIPLKTMTSYAVLVASLAVWPGWIERHFVALLDAAEHMLVKS